MATEAHLRGNKKYLKKQDEFKVRVPEGKKAEYKAQAACRGKSLNAYVISLIEKDKSINHE